jgi:hypothetical protein
MDCKGSAFAGGRGGSAPSPLLMSDAPFFIVGSSRSGTTLVRLMLCGHSRLHIPPETWYIADLVGRFPLARPLSPDEVDAAVSTITRHYRWPDLEISTDALRDEAAALVSPRLADVVALPYREHLRRAGKPRFGDKTPPYVAIMPELLTLFPDARFINLIRDGRDVAISFVDAHFHGRPYHADFEWTRALLHAERWRASLHASRMLDVRYEALVTNPEAELRRICEFLGETFEPQMLGYRDRLLMVPERERWIQGALARPIETDAVAVWRRRLTAAECLCIEASLAADLRRYGYAPRFGGVAWRPLLAAMAWLLRRLGPLLDIAIPALERRGFFRRHVYI